jgi:ferrous iron transport protein A
VRGRIRWPDKELTGMRLNEGIIGKVYKVTDVNVDEQITRRLEALGVNEQTSITILNKKGSGSLIIKVRGTRLALGRKISDGIMVKEA